ncbi:MAG: FIST C-terminal domain-containing protein [Lachnospiraceae bacterium]|nr:FIST C-terminal domain-containing protein [Lachnospiraceae bacterium]
MLQAKTGSSTNKCAKTAGSEAARAAKEGMSGIKLAYAYASCEYDLDAMLAGIADELPGVPVIGNTSFTGVITPEGFISGEDGFLGIMTVADEDMTVGVASAEKTTCPVCAGEEVAKKAMEAAGKTTPPDYFYMTAPSGEEEFFLKGITNVIGRVPFFGGTAADNTIEGNWKLYTDKGVFADGVAVAFFYTDKPMKNKFTGAYHETTDMGVITKIDGNRTLMEIDGVPALEKYAAWRGEDVSKFQGGALLSETITSPLGVKDRLGDLVAIRHPMNGNEDGSMAIGNNLAVGTAVIRMEASVDELISSTGDTLKELKSGMQAPGAFHLVHCGGRRAGIGDRIDEVAAQIKEAAGDVPFIVEFTFGEYGYEQDGLNTCGGLMLSFTGFEK